MLTTNVKSAPVLPGRGSPCRHASHRSRGETRCPPLTEGSVLTLRPEWKVPAAGHLGPRVTDTRRASCAQTRTTLQRCQRTPKATGASGLCCHCRLQRAQEPGRRVAGRQGLQSTPTAEPSGRRGRRPGYCRRRGNPPLEDRTLAGHQVAHFLVVRRFERTHTREDGPHAALAPPRASLDFSPNPGTRGGFEV